MQFVYTCRPGDNEELKYSIRSVIEFFPKADIWVVGDAPKWYSGNKIITNQSGTKYSNVKNNIVAMLESDEINDNFVYMNDDFFFTSKPNLKKYYYRGTIEQRVEQYDTFNPNSYQHKIMDIFGKLLKHGIKEPLDFELHTPVMIKKELLKKAISFHDLWRTAYFNLFDKPESVKLISDPKFYVEDIGSQSLSVFVNNSLPYLSSDDSSFEYIKTALLAQRFPKKTKFEKD